MAFNTYINDRLNHWAQWRIQRVQGAEGYPRQSAFARLGGGGEIDYSTRLPPDVNEQAWEVEQAVQALQPELKQCVMVFYCEVGTAEQKAKDCRCCRDTLYARLDRAHGKILDILNGYACGERPGVFAKDVLTQTEIA